ncbi:MAG: SDR family oxidoreductase [Armatimonadaceae bacterium]
MTLFHRGQHNPDLFPAEAYPLVETVRGDRENEADLENFASRSFDAVVDTCGYFPRQVRLSAGKLAGKTPLYCFISTVSVYADLSRGGVTEEAPLGTLEDPDTDQLTGETYGPLKVLCEQAAQEAFPHSCLIIRPGLIVGPHDVSDRFAYWGHRIAQGGDVLCPGNPAIETQVIDARDLAEWTVQLLEQSTTGVFNAVGPDYPLTLGTLFETCREVTQSDAAFVWVPEDFLLENEVQPWLELPLWIPQSGDSAGLDRISYQKAVEAGLTFRPLADTVRDTQQWNQTRAQENAWKRTLTREKEQATLAKYRESLPAPS